MKRKSANRTDSIVFREIVIVVSMPQIPDRQKRKRARSQLRAALTAIFDRLEAAATELLPPACRMEISGFEDGKHVVTRGGKRSFKP